MGKIREVFQKMSLKRSLVLLAVFCLSLVSALSVITILTCSSIQKKILDTRPIIITDYVIRDADSNDTENNNGYCRTAEIYTWRTFKRKSIILLVHYDSYGVLTHCLYYNRFFYGGKIILQMEIEDTA